MHNTNFRRAIAQRQYQVAKYKLDEGFNDFIDSAQNVGDWVSVAASLGGTVVPGLNLVGSGIDALSALVDLGQGQYGDAAWRGAMAGVGLLPAAGGAARLASKGVAGAAKAAGSAGKIVAEPVLAAAGLANKAGKAIAPALVAGQMALAPVANVVSHGAQAGQRVAQVANVAGDVANATKTQAQTGAKTTSQAVKAAEGGGKGAGGAAKTVERQAEKQITTAKQKAPAKAAETASQSSGAASGAAAGTKTAVKAVKPIKPARSNDYDAFGNESQSNVGDDVKYYGYDKTQFTKSGSPILINPQVRQLVQPGQRKVIDDSYNPMLNEAREMPAEQPPQPFEGQGTQARMQEPMLSTSTIQSGPFSTRARRAAMLARMKLEIPSEPGIPSPEHLVSGIDPKYAGMPINAKSLQIPATKKILRQKD